MTTFETGKSYGNDLTIEVISRTEKTVTFKTTAWGVKRCRVKICGNAEAIYFKAWGIYADEEFEFEKAVQIAYERAYYN